MSEVRGPVMIAATSMLRPPPARIGKITDDIVLPRSIELRKVGAGAAGLALALLLWVIAVGPIFRFSLESFLAMVLVGVIVGVLFVTVSPLRGESMTQWMSLLVSAQGGRKVRIGGKDVHAYIGIAPLEYVAAGRVRMLPGAVDVLPGTCDERGVPVSAEDVRRRKLEMIGGHTAAPSQADGFEPVQSLGSGTLPNSRAESLAARSVQRPTWVSPAGRSEQLPWAPQE